MVNRSTRTSSSPGFFLELADETGLALRTIWRMLQLWCEHGRLDEDS